jgi:precorrin-2 dehydrogenase/sirohydrochlorin ferrochelatase
MIPLAHDLSDEVVLVVGGGSVGARRARTFAAEARVVVVAPAFPETDYGGAERVERAIAPGDASALVAEHDPAVVVCATDDPAVNDAVALAARDDEALVNRADESGGRPAGEVAVPATTSDGDVRAALTTGGASPALARVLRERIEREIAGAGLVADATRRLRAGLHDDHVEPNRRRAAVRAAVRDGGGWAAARDGDRERVDRRVDRAARAALGERAGAERGEGGEP